MTCTLDRAVTLVTVWPFDWIVGAAGASRGLCSAYEVRVTESVGLTLPSGTTS
ncbi:MAG: hypothetical protein K0S70_3401 [Microbacterium sp.]|nr:hypothetical protein [Microbacterium sp.]